MHNYISKKTHIILKIRMKKKFKQNIVDSINLKERNVRVIIIQLLYTFKKFIINYENRNKFFLWQAG